ncbi:GNAT family N-acetyltransferase [Aliidiomarina sanyensis]|uniref:GNAT family N-acetyltransferase n=1 Tax=Aliidiomarina sanyensis TaxID=1249555 RepID=A0A432WRA5_9GAMM|nr:GNAT family N-acetyltransferase [Aliidiomarina sanyensis]RUO36304.1 GNAT family N-acetyltransferase [Aliidiomarina sanyensis]
MSSIASAEHQEQHSLQAASGELLYLGDEHLASAASLLFQAYRDDPLFQRIFVFEKEGYEQRLRAAIREELMFFKTSEQPMYGWFDGDTLEGVVCLTRAGAEWAPQRVWHWRLRMLLTAGFVSTRQMLEKERVIAEAMPVNDYHMLSFIAVHPRYQQQGLGALLVKAADNILSEVPESAGIAVFATRPEYARFFRQRGYVELRDVQVDSIRGQLLFHSRDDLG